jgi:hypothetical protein
MPSAFDDLLFNNLGGQAPADADITGIHKVSRVIPDGSQSQLLDFVKAEAGWVNDLSLKALAAAAKSMAKFDVQTHFILIAKKGQTSSNAAMVHLVHVDGGMKAVLSTDQFENLAVVDSEVHYHDYQQSMMGLPFNKLICLIGSRSLFHEMIKKKLMKSAQAARGTQRGDLLAAQMLGQTTIDGVLQAITQVANAWKAIADAFKTVNKETLKSVTKGQGFTQFASKSTFLRSLNINMAGWDQYKKTYMTLTGLDSTAQTKKEAEAFLTLAQFLPDNAWYFNTASFDINKSADTTSIVCMSKADIAFNKAHVLTVTASGTFKLAPDIYIYEKFRSVAGGIYQETSEVRKNVPRTLTNADIKALHALTLLNAINVMTKYFNIPMNLPASPLSL